LLTAAGLILNRALERRSYRLEYREELVRWADEYGVDRYLAAAVIHCESSNRKDVVSHAGAVGLMQIMPDTGEWIAGKLGLEDYSEARLTEPEVNIRMGCWYLSYLLDKYSGDRRLALAAYNAGPGNVEKWMQDGRFARDGELMEIPFPETARYVEKVQRAYEKYLTLYKKELD